jgi:hypothetical protein
MFPPNFRPFDPINNDERYMAAILHAVESGNKVIAEKLDLLIQEARRRRADESGADSNPLTPAEGEM